MLYSVLAVVILLAAGLAVLYAARISRRRRIALQRIGTEILSVPSTSLVYEPERDEIETYPRRFQFAGPAAGLISAIAVYWLTARPPYAVAAGVLTGTAGYLIELYWAEMKIRRIEEQLADAIDLMVASLRAGSALLSALEATSREAKMPIREELDNMIGRIRLGEDPRATVRDLALRVPLESFRLFSHSLLVHWETGGSLALSLRTVGRTVRDRLEVARRIAAQAVEAQISVFAAMGISYGLTLLTLHTNPRPLVKLLTSQIGSYGAAAVIVLQAAGMFWIWRMSRIRF
jgi:tight adherence protein B